MRRRLRPYRCLTKNFSTFSLSEIYSYAFYLYNISKYDKELDLHSGFYHLLHTLAKYSNKLENLAIALECCVSDLEKNNFFNATQNNLIKQNKNRRHRCLSEYEEYNEIIENNDNFSEIQQYFKYSIDNHIASQHNCTDIESLNLYRCYYLEYTNSKLLGLLGKIVFLTFFTEISEIEKYAGFSIRDIFNQNIKAKYLKKINDLSDFDFLNKDIDLSKQEIKVLQFFYRYKTYPHLSDILDGDEISNKDEIILNILNLSDSELATVLRKDKKLINFGFIEESSDFNSLNPDLCTVIDNQDLNLYFSELIQEIDTQSAFDLNSFSVDKDKTKIICKMLKNEAPVSILLYGKPGSGKTEYAKALAKTSGKKVIIFKNEAEISNENNTICKLNLLLSLNKKDSILIIDEAESILKTTEMSFFGPMPTKKKGLVNKMLDNSQNTVIWIVNHISQFDESTKRRFTMSCKFGSMPKKILNKIIISKLEPLCLSKDLQKDILKRFEKYNITGASIDNVIKAISSFNDISEEEIKTNVEIVLKENSLLLNGNSKMRETIASSYDSSVLNTSINAEKIVKMVKNAQNFAIKNQQDKGSSAIRMLFYGVSGTGKTEFARYLSEILGKKILLKRASDILNKYVGGTEENIAKAFAEAAEKDQILLFDEADTFFADRNNAKNSWERTQVNEFLTQMEEFPGILICTTNLKNIMDKATLRRFHITVEFNPLQEEGIKTLLQKFFPAYFSKEEIGNTSLSSLLSYNSVTPGDFGRLAGKIRFLDEEDISPKMIIDELCAIQEEKDTSRISKIGFAV